MSSLVTGWRLSPMVKVIAGLLPVSPWKFQRARGVFATTMRDQDGQSPARTKKVPNSNQPHKFYGGAICAPELCLHRADLFA